MHRAVDRASKGGEWPLVVGLVTIAGMLGWEKLRPRRLKLVPGALVGVAAGTALALGLRLDIAHVRVPASLLASISPPTLADLSILLSPAVVLSAVAIAFATGASRRNPSRVTVCTLTHFTKSAVESPPRARATPLVGNT